VGKICRRLDGVPLAIEVAAARMDSFDLSVLSRVLEGRFRLQMVGRSTALPRHRTLAATLDWSFDALTEQEQIAFRRLSVFRGHFSFDAARYIVGCHGIEPADIGGLIANLVAKSLVTTGGRLAQGRHRLLDTTRAYAKEKLDKSGESSLILRRHATYYEAVLTAATRTDLIWWADWERAYGLELYQIRAALNQLSDSRDRPVRGARLRVLAG
jgi:predicted ATPase